MLGVVGMDGQGGDGVANGFRITSSRQLRYCMAWIGSDGRY